MSPPMAKRTLGDVSPLTEMWRFRPDRPRIWMAFQGGIVKCGYNQWPKRTPGYVSPLTKMRRFTLDRPRIWMALNRGIVECDHHQWPKRTLGDVSPVIENVQIHT